MLKLNKVYLQMIPHGPAIGLRGLIIDIGETDDKDAKYNLYDDFKQRLKTEVEFPEEDKKIPLELFYNTAIDGTKRTYIGLIGGSIDKKSNYKEFSDFSVAISKESVSFQKSLRIDKMSPPFLIFFGKPMYLTGSVQDSGFYQHFNCITGLIKQKDETDFKLESFNKLSAQEILNHPFGSLVVQIDHNLGGNWDEIFQPVLGYEINNKIYVADGCNSSSLREYCLLSGLRYQDYLSNEWTH